MWHESSDNINTTGLKIRENDSYQPPQTHQLLDLAQKELYGTHNIINLRDKQKENFLTRFRGVNGCT